MKSQFHHHWSIAEAKARFSEVVRLAERDGPQAVTRHGGVTVYIVSAADFDARDRQGPDLVEVMRRCPHPDVDLDLPKLDSTVRDIDW